MALPSITWAQVEALDASLATVPVPTQTSILGQVDRRVRHPGWGAKYVDGKAYLAAHFATVSRRGAAGGVGPVTGMSADGVAATFAAPPMSAGSYESTVWGQEYLRLRRGIAALRGIVVA
jgi:hypothetical protein